MIYDVDELAVAPMRALSSDAVQKAEFLRASAPLKDLERKFAFTLDAIADARRGVLAGGAAA